MCVGQTNAEVVQTTSLSHQPHFALLRHSHLGQEVQQRKRLGAFPEQLLVWQIQGKFRGDEGMDNDLALVKKLAQFFVSPA